MSNITTCPSCGGSQLSRIYEIQHVPVHSVLLFSSKKEAVNYPKGDIVLNFCDSCGFITNMAFDPSFHEYSSKYEGTQAFSPTFNVFHRNLVQSLIQRYNLKGKDIIEIGCGQGEFLSLLCELGHNRGIGFDPAFDKSRYNALPDVQVDFIKDFYSEKYADYRADFICCKMTLEHIQNTADFVSTIRNSLLEQPDTLVFFQIPDVVRILREQAFWDIYYEHCSYFSLGSLARLFRRCRFDIIDLWKDYDDQYLMITAKPGTGQQNSLFPQENDLEELNQLVKYFQKNCEKKIAAWKKELEKIDRDAQKAVIWGASSKGVAFLTTLNIYDDIEFAVDINPHKNDTYMAGTGQKIVLPEFLKEYKPTKVIVMNPIYCDEIKKDLVRLGVQAEIVPVTAI